MIYALLLIVTVASLAVYASVFANARRAFEVPFIVALFTLIWIVPQAIALTNVIGVPEIGYRDALIMSLAMVVLTTIGWRFGLSRRLGHWKPRTYSLKRLELATVAATLFAAAMVGLIYTFPDDMRAEGQWTGPITIIYIFTQVKFVSYALSLVLYLRTKKYFSLCLILLNVAVIFPSVFVYFRRADTFIFVFFTAFALCRFRGLTPPRWIYIVVPVLALLAINSVGELRRISGGYALNPLTGEIEARVPTLSELRDVDWTRALKFSQFSENSEFKNAVYEIEVFRQDETPTLGASIWDRFIFAYVPGQLIGPENKADLMLLDERDINAALSAKGYNKIPGQTSTGLAQPYRDFYFVGALAYLFVGFFSARLFRGSYVDDFATVCYGLTVAHAAHTVTHNGYYYFVDSLPIFLSTFVVFAFAAVRRFPKRRDSIARHA
jgi:hypothetical protein